MDEKELPARPTGVSWSHASASQIQHIIQAVEAAQPSPSGRRIGGLVTGSPQVLQDVAGTVVNQGPRVGRNAPCPCGSGEKFKRCCGKPAPVRRPPQIKPAPANWTDPATGKLRPYYDVFCQIVKIFPPEAVYTYLETGLIISPTSRPACDPGNLQEHDAAMRAWREMSEEEHARHLALWQDYCRDYRTFPHWRSGSDDGDHPTLPT